MSKAIFILGMHRSGTSALARVVNLLGAELGTSLMQAAEDNKRGFWEHEDAVQIHEKLLKGLGQGWQDGVPLPEGWEKTAAAKEASAAIAEIIERDFKDSALWAIKDPRLSLLFPLWEPLLKQRNIQPHCIVAWRNPLEVAASLDKRDAMPKPSALLCWLAYTLESLRHAQHYPQAVLSYDALLEDWQKAANLMQTDLELAWEKENAEIQGQVAAFLSPSLRHHKQEVALNENELEGCVGEALSLLQSWDAEKFERLHAKWTNYGAALSPLLREARKEVSATDKELSAANEACAKATHAQADIVAQFDKLQQNHEALWQQIHDLEGALNNAKHAQNDAAIQNSKIQHERDVLQAKLTALLESSSWKMTQPLRNAKAALQRETKKHDSE